MGLPPLRWVAEEDLIYDSATNTLHRPGCPHASTVTSPRPVPAHGALQLVWAPTLCDCRPDVTLALNARGFAYYLLREHKNALADLDEAIRLNSKYLNAYQNRSRARKAAGDAAGSAADEQKARELKGS